MHSSSFFQAWKDKWQRLWLDWKMQKAFPQRNMQENTFSRYYPRSWWRVRELAGKLWSRRYIIRENDSPAKVLGRGNDRKNCQNRIKRQSQKPESSFWQSVLAGLRLYSVLATQKWHFCKKKVDYRQKVFSSRSRKRVWRSRWSRRRVLAGLLVGGFAGHRFSEVFDSDGVFAGDSRVLASL